jgi:phosphoglycerate kinase
MTILAIDEIPIDDKKVFIRVDFNVPLNKAGEITDDTRIRAALPTIKYALKKNARIIIGSHLGRPGGVVDPDFSLDVVARRLSELLDMDIILSDSVVGDSSIKLAGELKSGQILLLENLRFHLGEKKNDRGFAKKLASLAEVYINDAFGTAHRAHASTAGMAEFIEYKGGGFLLKKEIDFFTRLLESPEPPFTAILGGAKVKDKVGVIKNLLDKVDVILIGGAMANTFLAAQGHKMGNSKIEKDKIELCKELISGGDARKTPIMLPVDLLVADSIDAKSAKVVTIAEGVPDDLMALDIGPETIKLFSKRIMDSRTVFWNGPMGVFENPVLAGGTVSLANVLAESRALSVVGGGDSVAAVNQAEVTDKINHVSTGGGASLEIMEGKNLPGIGVLLV